MKKQLGDSRLSDLKDILFYDDTHGWIAGDRGMFLETQDGGRNWTLLKTGTRQDIIGIRFVGFDRQWGWAMQRNGTILYTTNGQKWSQDQTPMRLPIFEEDPPRSFRMNDVGFGKFSEGWAVGATMDRFFTIKMVVQYGRLKEHLREGT